MAKRSSPSLPKKGESQSMWKKIAEEMNFPESYVSVTLGFLVVIIGGILLFNYFNKTSLPGSQNQTGRDSLTPSANQVKEGEHMVAAQDTLWSISEKYYGTGYNWQKIAEANKLQNPDTLEAGSILVIPTVSAPSMTPAPTSPAASAPSPTAADILADSTQQPRNYTVARGDSLWKIAVSQYGDGYAWVKIARENNLVNPNIIHPGNVLKLP